MRHSVPAASAVLLCSLSLAAMTTSAPRPGVDWPHFRGISAGGIAEGFVKMTPTALP